MINLDQHVGRYTTWKDIPEPVKVAYLTAQCEKYEAALAIAKSTKVWVNVGVYYSDKMLPCKFHSLYS